MSTPRDKVMRAILDYEMAKEEAAARVLAALDKSFRDAILTYTSEYIKDRKEFRKMRDTISEATGKHN